VALESTLISHGFAWPDNLEVARASEAAVRESGAVPATVAIHEANSCRAGGRRLDVLARAERGSVMKAARPSLAPRVASGGWAATTVSATMIAAHAAGISVFATGGIGGVHRSPEARRQRVPGHLVGPGRARQDADGRGLRRPKAILDVPNTLEVLETRGVPVVAIGQAELPGFYARSAGRPAPHSVPDEAAAATLVATPPRARAWLGRAGVRAGSRRRGAPRGRGPRRGRQATREADAAGSTALT
jgi:pseudouridine-5'-phosphate glycosidase